jgi:hypothetical protein
MISARIARALLLSAAALALSPNARADDMLSYRSEGACAGDFDRVELKSYWLRVDAGADAHRENSMIYDHAEKLAIFIDHATRTFMQTELDEDAVDLQADIMKSLRTRMRRETGADPFEMAAALCPGLAAGSRDRQPGETIDCGNGVTLGGSPEGPGGKPMSRDEMMAAMKEGRMPVDPGMQQIVQKMMEQQLAGMPPDQRAQIQGMMANGSAMQMPGMTVNAPPRPSPQRIDRDGGEVDVNGITCLRREHLAGDEMLREDCYASPAALHLGDIETRRLARFAKSLRAWSRSLVPEGFRAESDDRVLVRRICYSGGRESGRATLTIDAAPIADSRFEVPAGYTPMDLGTGRVRGRDTD